MPCIAASKADRHAPLGRHSVAVAPLTSMSARSCCVCCNTNQKSAIAASVVAVLGGAGVLLAERSCCCRDRLPVAEIALPPGSPGGGFAASGGRGVKASITESAVVRFLIEGGARRGLLELLARGVAAPDCEPLARRAALLWLVGPLGNHAGAPPLLFSLLAAWVSPACRLAWSSREPTLQRPFMRGVAMENS